MILDVSEYTLAEDSFGVYTFDDDDSGGRSFEG